MKRRKTQRRSQEDNARAELERQEAERKAHFEQMKLRILGSAALLRQDLDPSSDFMQALDDKAEKAIGTELDERRADYDEAVKCIDNNGRKIEGLTRDIIDEMRSKDDQAEEHKEVYDIMDAHPEMFVSMPSIGGDNRFKDLRDERTNALNHAGLAHSLINQLDLKGYREWRAQQIERSRDEITKVEGLVKTMESMEPIQKQNLTTIRQALLDNPTYERIERSEKNNLLPTGKVWRRSPDTDFNRLINMDDEMMEADNLRYLNVIHKNIERIEPLMRSEDGKLLARVDGFRFSNDKADGYGVVSVGYEIIDPKSGEVSDHVDVYKNPVKGVTAARFDIKLENGEIGETEQLDPRFNEIRGRDPLDNLGGAIDLQLDSVTWIHESEAVRAWGRANGDRNNDHERGRRAELADTRLDHELEKISSYESAMYDEGYDAAY